MLLIPLGLYLVMRSHALGPVGTDLSSDLSPAANPTSFAATLDTIQLPEWNRLLTAAGGWYQSLLSVQQSQFYWRLLQQTLKPSLFSHLERV